eukprot:2759245-Amphidinium_carterae.1
MPDLALEANSVEPKIEILAERTVPTTACLRRPLLRIFEPCTQAAVPARYLRTGPTKHSVFPMRAAHEENEQVVALVGHSCMTGQQVPLRKTAAAQTQERTLEPK